MIPVSYHHVLCYIIIIIVMLFLCCVGSVCPIHLPTIPPPPPIIFVPLPTWAICNMYENYYSSYDGPKGEDAKRWRFASEGLPPSPLSMRLHPCNEWIFHCFYSYLLVNKLFFKVIFPLIFNLIYLCVILEVNYQRIMHLM